MKRTAIAAHGLRSGEKIRHGSKAIPLLIVLAAPVLGACSLSPAETAATSTTAAPATKEPAKARRHAVALAKADPREKECLVRAMYFESNRSSESGLLGVGTVVMNRVESAKYPETICGVVGAPRQFATGVLSRPMTDKVLPKVEAIAEDILNGRRNEAVGAAKHFHMAGLRFGYNNMHYVTVAGGNAFYVRGERPERRRIEEPTIQLASASTTAVPLTTASSSATTASSFASAPLAFAPEMPAPQRPALETPLVTLVKNAPLPPGRPLDLDLPKAPLRALVAPPKDDRRVALLQASDIRGSLPSR
ncbi:spore germination cell wall hydrolase CwlJ-like protein [Bosea sp. BE271]|uniref:cell wall hydrolase n=1 Tax=Bosea TaxID=85413 RepID=UPI00285527A6|nr:MULTISPECIES: cell wall hydrolase [Bosea]MDR6828224.1 spore germination cell wall hydrolase CwlJ-like protein [Bosea robiniae]MDR6897804.1 spore germination cell wall hydrolase CwlJ-like protein [Bosea sp. BE109]MDR7141223.1 spore germination cell wall hydrolase CwlJ-like protein [Bosea sp. BE168]MDR7177885.1 spore germination cell wall hydrolase CwlJ-like protein [Bosea sp. BE271]